MAGKFVNTKYQDTVQSLVDGVKDKINSPFYQYNNEKPTIVTYYNINRKKSCVDEGTGMAYANIGDKSSLKYNKIDKIIEVFCEGTHIHVINHNLNHKWNDNIPVNPFNHTHKIIYPNQYVTKSEVEEMINNALNNK